MAGWRLQLDLTFAVESFNVWYVVFVRCGAVRLPSHAVSKERGADLITGVPILPPHICRQGKFIADPSPGWEPPSPTDAPPGGAGPLGSIASVALDGDGALWALYRGSRVWRQDSFAADGRLRDQSPIAEDVVVQVRRPCRREA